MDINKLKQSLDYDPETGLFTWKYNTPRRLKGDIAGCKQLIRHDTYDEVYILIGVGRILYRAHRLAFIFMGKEVPKYVDHINGDGTDNRWSNLRDATATENAKNRRLASSNSSGYVGVSFERRTNSWKAYISVNNKRIHLGRYATAEEAHNTRVQKLKELGGCGYSQRHGS